MKSLGNSILKAFVILVTVFASGACGQDPNDEEVWEPYWFKQQECLTEWVSLDSMKGVWVENRAFCDTGRTSMWPNGIHIFYVDFEMDTAGVMWSHLSPESWEGMGFLACPLDFTGDGQTELLTLWFDLGNLWGTVHRLHLEGSSAHLESHVIPTTGYDDIMIETFPPATSVIDTLVFPYRTYDEQEVVVYYDSIKDSLQVVSRK